jgi:hypothetical protein
MIFSQHLHVLPKFIAPFIPSFTPPSAACLYWRRGFCRSALLLPALLLPALIMKAAIADTMRVGWYGPGFDGDYTASGEVFSRYNHTAAHPSWPFGTLIKLTNPDTGSTVVVRVNDRSGGALDISEQAARDLNTYSTGISAVEVEILQWGE